MLLADLQTHLTRDVCEETRQQCRQARQFPINPMPSQLGDRCIFAGGGLPEDPEVDVRFWLLQL